MLSISLLIPAIVLYDLIRSDFSTLIISILWPFNEGENALNAEVADRADEQSN